MASVTSIGVSGQPMNSPPLTPWQAAVRDALNSSDTTVNARISSAVAPLATDAELASAISTHEAAANPHPGTVWGRWTGTQSAYDAIGTKDPNTLYVVI